MRRCVARVGNEVPRMTFLFFLLLRVRLFLLASRSFRQSTLASKFRDSDPASTGAFSPVRCSRRIGVELDERSKRFWPGVFEQKFSKVIQLKAGGSPFSSTLPSCRSPFFRSILSASLLSCFFANVEDLLCSRKRVTSSDHARNLRFV